MKRFTDFSAALSIHIITPLIFILSLTFFVIQTFMVTLPESIRSEESAVHSLLTKRVTKIQGTINNFYRQDNISAVEQEIKMLHVGDNNIRMAAIFDADKELLHLSSKTHRSHALASIRSIQLEQDYNNNPKSMAPQLHTGEIPYQLHAVVPVTLPLGPGTEDQTRHGYLFLEYDYASNITQIKNTTYHIFVISLTAWVLFFILFGILVYHLLLKKIVALKEATMNIEQGFYSQSVPVEGFSEVKAIAQAFNSMSKKIAQDIYTQATHASLLAQNKAQLARSQQIAQLGSISWHIHASRMEWSDEIYRLLDIPESTPPSWELLLNLVESDTKREELDNSIAMVQKTGQLCDIECPIVTAKQQRKVLHLQCEVQNNLLLDTMLFITLQDITEYKAIENALRNEKETAQNYLDIVGVMILVLDSEKNVLMINKRGCEIIGYDYDEVIGKNWIENFLPERFRHKVNKVGDTLVDKQKELISYFENPVLTKSGKERLIAWRNSTLYDNDGNAIGILTSGEDITEMRNAQSELEKSEYFYRSVFSSVHEAIFVLDRGRFIDCNEQTLPLFGKTEIELLGMHFLDLNPQMSCSTTSLSTALAEVEKGEPVDFQCIIHPEGSQRHIVAEITLSAFGEKNEKIIATARDITQKLEQEKILKLHTRQAQMGEMISMIAHQWRQPLTIINSITGQLQIEQMKRGEEDNALMEKLKKIEHQVFYLSETISDFRDFFRPDKPKERTRISLIIQKVLDLLEGAMAARGITIKTEIIDDSLLETFTNEVVQVVMTLLKNAQDAFEERKTDKRVVRITAQNEGAFAVIRISDNAGGIPATVIDDIFLPYFSTKDAKHGTGLGLYMSKTVIEEHCMGHLEVANEGEGATFTLRLPQPETPFY